MGMSPSGVFRDDWLLGGGLRSLLLSLVRLLANEARPASHTLRGSVKNLGTNLCLLPINTLRSRVLELSTDLLVCVNPVRAEEAPAVHTTHTPVIQDLRLKLSVIKGCLCVLWSQRCLAGRTSTTGRIR